MGMLKAIGQNATLGGALIVGAVVSGMTAGMAVSARGAFGPSVLQAESVAAGLGAILLSLVVATVLAIIVARVCNTAVGLFALGGALFGLAWRTENVEELAKAGGSLTLVAVETALWAVLVLIATTIVFRLGGRLDDVEPDEGGRTPHPLLSLEALKCAAAGVLVLPVVWLLAQSADKGQVIGSVFCGGMAAGLVGRLLSQHVQPVVIFAAVVLFGAIGHAIGVAMLTEPLIEALRAQTIPHFSRPMPADYAAGALMGVAVGIGWAKSFMHHDEKVEEPEPPEES